MQIEPSLKQIYIISLDFNSKFPKTFKLYFKLIFYWGRHEIPEDIVVRFYIGHRQTSLPLP